MAHRHFDLAINSGLLVWTLILAFTTIAAWLDLRTRKIPNWLTVPGFVAGICIHLVFGGWRGALSSLEGAGLALAILLPMVLVRGLGAGDWKLMGAVGAMLGRPVWLLFFLLISALVAGAMAVVTVIWTRQVRTTFRNIFVLVQGFFIFGWRGNPKLTIDNPGLLKLPFGVAAAMTAMICFVISHWTR